MLHRVFRPTPLAEKLTLLACLGLAVLLLILPDSAQIVLADRLGLVLTGPIHGLRDFVADVGRVRGENAALKARLVALDLERAKVARFRRDEEQLRRALRLHQARPGGLLPCEVVGRRAGRYPTLIKLRSASAAPWQRYQPVMSVLGLVGRVREVVSPREVWVELLTAPDLALGCELERNGVLGILRPRGGDFVLDMVARDEDVRPGDRVCTSGIAELAEVGGGEQAQALFPRGLPVGIVRQVESPSDQLFLDIYVEALASLRRHDVVFVVTEPGDWFVEALTIAEPDTAATDSTVTNAARGAGERTTAVDSSGTRPKGAP